MIKKDIVESILMYTYIMNEVLENNNYEHLSSADLEEIESKLEDIVFDYFT